MNPIFASQILIVLTLLCPLAINAQSQSQIADRKITSTSVEIFDSRKEIQQKIVFNEFDKYGHVTLLIEKDKDSNVLKWESTQYDRNDNEIARFILGKNGDTLKKYQFFYNNLNQLISMQVYDNHNQLIENQIIEYDRNGNKTKELSYNGEKELESTTTYLYDHKDMLLKKVVTDRWGKVIYSKKITYQYE